jgi:hypothetical protein
LASILTPLNESAVQVFISADSEKNVLVKTGYNELFNVIPNSVITIYLLFDPLITIYLPFDPLITIYLLFDRMM